jgi:hypothetical protein
MTTKDSQHPARSALVRPGLAHSRTNSHSIIASSLNTTHRVTRRKSMTSTGTNRAAVVAMLSETEPSKSLPITANARRHTVSRASAPRSSLVGSLPSHATDSIVAAHLLDMHIKVEAQESTMDDDLNDAFPDMGEDRVGDESVGRIGDGQSQAKEGRKSNRAELRCDKCGKGYKHSSCLTKHLLVSLKLLLPLLSHPS